VSKPWYQTVATYLIWLIAGFVGLGSVIDAWLNAIEWVDLPRAAFLTVLVFLIWLYTAMVRRFGKLRWVATSGTVTAITKLGPKIRSGAIGMLLLVWAAAAANQLPMTTRTSAPPITIAVDGTRRTLKTYDTVDLDGDGQQELVTATSGELEVFRSLSQSEWSRILWVRIIEGAYCDYYGDYAILKLLDNQTNQVLAWTQCGTGAYLTFEVYRDRGLAFMDRIFNSELDEITSPDAVDFMESSPQVVNGELYIAHGGGELYLYTWSGTTFAREPLDLDFGSNCVTVEFWYESGRVQASPSTLSVSVGHCIYVRYARERGKIPWDQEIRIQHTSGIFEAANALVLYARQAGEGEVLLWGLQDPLVRVTVVSD
jgi:hypothetical protein